MIIKSIGIVINLLFGIIAIYGIQTDKRESSQIGGVMLLITNLVSILGIIM